MDAWELGMGYMDTASVPGMRKNLASEKDLSWAGHVPLVFLSFSVFPLTF